MIGDGGGVGDDNNEGNNGFNEDLWCWWKPTRWYYVVGSKL